MKKLLLAATFLAAFGLAANQAQASVSIDLQIGGIYQSDGSTKVPIGTVGILVASTTDNSFLATNTATSSSLAGTNIAVGQFLGGSDDMIVGVMQATFLDNNNNGFFTNPVQYTFTGNWGANDPLAIYWFPDYTSLSSAITLKAGDHFGFFTSNLVDTNSGSSSALVTPGDSNAVQIYYYTPNLAGTTTTVTQSQLSTTQVVSVPEPSTFALLGVGVGFAGWMARRNKKA